jgi:hypothetical protein
MKRNDAKFSIDIVGESTGIPWKGVFKVKLHRSFREDLRQDELRRQLLGSNPNGADRRAVNVADIFSFLWVRLLETPQWWEKAENGLGLEDDNLIAEVYSRAMQEVVSAQEETKKAGEEAEAELKKTE